MCLVVIFATTTLDPAAAIAAMQQHIQPVLQKATDWSLVVGLGFVSAQAFYSLVIRLIKL